MLFAALQITVIESLIEKCDVILLGGGMIFTFFKAKGLGVGKSLVRTRLISVQAVMFTPAVELSFLYVSYGGVRIEYYPVDE